MKITILTLFPEMFSGVLENSIIKRALAKGIFEVEIKNIRDYTKDKYRRVDTPPIGGGAGLVMKAQPIINAIDDLKTETSYVLLTSPKGVTFNENKAKEYAKMDHIIIICGHYEGVDARVENFVDENISIGDFILTGGELPAMVILDSTVRLLQGAIAGESTIDETFESNLLEYPQYTEPYDFRGYKVPDILYSGNHQAIQKYRYKKSLQETYKYRKDLFSTLNLSKKDLELLNEEENASREADAIKKGIKK